MTADTIGGFIVGRNAPLPRSVVCVRTAAEGTLMTQTNILNAADYADALLTARRAKNTVFLVILFLLLGELALFFTARYTTILSTASDTRMTALRGVLQWAIGLIDFLGLIMPALLAV